MNKFSFAVVAGTAHGADYSAASSSQLHSWLMTLPTESLVRLRNINMSTVSSKHVILSLAYGLYDRHIDRRAPY
jgi:hypothetical protein